ncbi:holo-ACP synthase [Ramlibacter rhizophilus]|uniref:Holo-[acyl-carrier-protein] synthase n=1 Tax=Ramlibacter rhizophilus TaxID=1781167 RepID=A0A4Z0BPC7_9BURK|nr:holo-ACP synthase [Ramlibacter rhizophilus]TFZ01166.1 holo-[acyl-carrier-protein] synthase [Ramlibacter rhizophilus]
MTFDISKLTDPLAGISPAEARRLVRLGLDLVHIPRIQESLERHGAAFERKLFSAAEIAYANASPAHRAARFAARFAAKEAVIKAVGLAEHGVSWREIEVVRDENGHCRLRLEGRTLALARERGTSELLLSLTHDGDYAAAVVAALSDKLGGSG